MFNSKNIEIIKKVFNKAIKSKYVYEAVMLVENDSDFSINLEYGNKTIDSPIIAASVSKLFTTSCILILLEQKKISIDDTLDIFFDEEVLKGLHIFKGIDYSFKITISNLLFQTSGLPDWFEDVEKELMIKEDRFLTFEDMIVRTKKGRTVGIPGSKTYYSDINFDILGKIIEKVTNMPLEKVYKKYIFDKLNLTKTYLPVNEKEVIPKIYYKNDLLYRPKSIICSRASGGCVTTTKELMMFLKAFFGGKLFSKEIFETLSTYGKLQINKGPIYYGGGYMQIPLGTIITLFMGSGEVIGHSGATGSFAFYYPRENLYFVGDFNQLSDPGLPIRTVLKITMKMK